MPPSFRHMPGVGASLGYNPTPEPDSVGERLVWERVSAGVSQTEEFLILSLLVSNFESLRVTSPDQLPQTMSVDWVRVWQK